MHLLSLLLFVCSRRSRLHLHNENEETEEMERERENKKNVDVDKLNVITKLERKLTLFPLSH